MKVIVRPIEMVAWFNKEGIPHPVRFRFEEDNRNIVIKIDRILYKDKEKIAGNDMIKFTCQSCINAVEKTYEIKYELKTCKWLLFKI